MMICSVEQDSSFDSFPADWTFGHPVSAHLAGSVTAQEDHVLQTVKTHWTHCLEGNVELFKSCRLETST